VVCGFTEGKGSRENGARIGTPDDRNFETEGEAIELGLRERSQDETP